MVSASFSSEKTKISPEKQAINSRLSFWFNALRGSFLAEAVFQFASYFMIKTEPDWGPIFEVQTESLPNFVSHFFTQSHGCHNNLLQ
jgi:hypothetical protein